MPKLYFSKTQVNVSESDTYATFTVNLDAKSTKDVSFSYYTEDGAAKAGEDYVAKSGTLTIKAGKTASDSIKIQLKDDTKVENSEGFLLKLKSPTNAELKDTLAIALIADNDKAPVNRAPTATATDKTLAPGQGVSLSDLFRYSDPDGDAITQFAVKDRDIGGAYLTRNGVRMTDGQLHDPKPISEIGLWKVVGASGAAVDHIGFNAVDSKGAYSTSVAATVTTTAPADTTAPWLSSSSPRDDAPDVPVGADIVLTFNEKVMQGTGAIEVRTVAGNAPVASAVTFAGTAVKIDPNASLAPGTDYYVKVPAGAIKDSAGNSYAGITSTSAFNFKTAPAATDAGNTLATATALTLGGTVSQSVGVGTDTDDYFRLTATANGRVIASLTGLTADINLRALNASGAEIVVSQRTGTAAETLSFNVVAGQTYNFRVDPDGAVSSDYRITTGYWTEPVGVALPIRIAPVVTQGYDGDTSHSTTSGVWDLAVDFDLAIRDDVFAVSSGTVVEVRTTSTGKGDTGGGGFGNFVTILHDSGFYATYAHLSAVSVVVGQQVSSSSMIGDGGNTGYVFGDDGSHLHLHFGTQITSTADGFRIASGANDTAPPAFFTEFATQDEVAGLVNPSSSTSIQTNDIFGSARAVFADDDNDELSGTPANNRIFGLSGNDRLNGGGGNDTLVGGSGNDRLTGGVGSDVFAFGSLLGSANVDTVTDFSVTDDKIWLRQAIFSAAFSAAGPSGALSTAAFRMGSAAADADDTIIYNSSTGALIYDSNGNGAGGAVQFATLGTGLALTGAEFFLF